MNFTNGSQQSVVRSFVDNQQRTIVYGLKNKINKLTPNQSKNLYLDDQY